MQGLMEKLHSRIREFGDRQDDILQDLSAIKGMIRGAEIVASVVQQHIADVAEMQAEDPDAERRNTPEYMYGELSSEQLAEAVREQVAELLRRREEKFDYDSDRKIQYGLRIAEETLMLLLRLV